MFKGENYKIMCSVYNGNYKNWVLLPFSHNDISICQAKTNKESYNNIG
jgi:hypothetical protein